jgi:hypothetical protein
MKKRLRFKQTLTLEHRLTRAAKRFREQAKALPPCPERNELIRKAREAEATCQMSEWLASPGLPPPE